MRLFVQSFILIVIFSASILHSSDRCNHFVEERFMNLLYTVRNCFNERSDCPQTEKISKVFKEAPAKKVEAYPINPFHRVPPIVSAAILRFTNNVAVASGQCCQGESVSFDHGTKSPSDDARSSALTTPMKRQMSLPVGSFNCLCSCGELGSPCGEVSHAISAFDDESKDQKNDAGCHRLKDRRRKSFGTVLQNIDINTVGNLIDCGPSSPLNDCLAKTPSDYAGSPLKDCPTKTPSDCAGSPLRDCCTKSPSDRGDSPYYDYPQAATPSDCADAGYHRLKDSRKKSFGTVLQNLDVNTVGNLRGSGTTGCGASSPLKDCPTKTPSDSRVLCIDN